MTFGRSDSDTRLCANKFETPGPTSQREPDEQSVVLPVYADGVSSSANAPGCPTAGMNMGLRPSLAPIQSIVVQKASRGLVGTDSSGMNPTSPISQLRTSIPNSRTVKQRRVHHRAREPVVLHRQPRDRQPRGAAPHHDDPVKLEAVWLLAHPAEHRAEVLVLGGERDDIARRAVGPAEAAVVEEDRCAPRVRRPVLGKGLHACILCQSQTGA
jgi:hypothetical protein